MLMLMTHLSFRYHADMTTKGLGLALVLGLGSRRVAPYTPTRSCVHIDMLKKKANRNKFHTIV
jgi:hypothetical protein